MYPKSLQQLIENFKVLPGVGEKTAERYALTILQMDEEKATDFGMSVIDARRKIHTCRICHNFTEEEICPVCSDKARNSRQICVVQDAKDILAMERMHTYNGLYHVLGGVISTNKGVLPQDLNIQTLLERIDENTEEIILALNPTMEGETTVLYLSKILAQKNVQVTRLAHGLPMGGHLDYTDELTLSKALENRQKI